MNKSNMLERRGQGAMDYAMTYGWGIIAVLVLGIVLWQLGYLDGDSVGSVSSTGFPKLKPHMSRTKLTSDGVFVAVFTNGIGKNINFRGVKLRDQIYGSTLFCCSHSTLDGECQGFDGAVDVGGLNAAEFNAGEKAFIGTENLILVEMNGCDITPDDGRGDKYWIQAELFYDIDLGKGLTSYRSEVGAFRGSLE